MSPPPIHDELAIAEEEAIARGARGDAPASELLLTRNAEPPRRRTGRHDYRAGSPFLVARPNGERPLRQVDVGDVHREDLRAEARGLLLHLIHELGAEEPVGEARIVLHVGRQHQLTTGLETFQDEGCEVRPRGVEGGRTRPAPSDHDHVPRSIHWVATG